MMCCAAIDKQLAFLKLGDSSEELSSVVGVAVKPVCLKKPKELAYTVEAGLNGEPASH